MRRSILNRIVLLLLLLAEMLFTPATVVAQTATAARGVAPPTVESPSCVVMDAISGEVLYEKNAYVKRAPASLTKIMTLVLTLEAVNEGRISLQEEAVASENAWELGGTEVWAEPGESMPIEEWLKAVAVGSANDGAVVLAEHLAGSVEAFAEMMNQRAKELGMKDTTYKNPHGLDEDGHETTAMDIAILSRHAISVPHLLDYTKIYQTPFRGGKNELTNFNKLVYLYPGCDGLKTGMTNKSGYCISATAKKGDSRFIVVIMGAATPDQRLNEAWKLLDWAFANYRSLEILKAGDILCQTRVLKGKVDTLDVAPQNDLALTLAKGEKGEVTRKIQLEKAVAPVKKGDVLGNIVIEVDGKTVAQVPLVAACDVPRAGFLDYAMKYLRAFLVGR